LIKVLIGFEFIHFSIVPAKRSEQPCRERETGGTEHQNLIKKHENFSFLEIFPWSLWNKLFNHNSTIPLATLYSVLFVLVMSLFGK
jgi:hypothetical protein